MTTPKRRVHPPSKPKDGSPKASLSPSSPARRSGRQVQPESFWSSPWASIWLLLSSLSLWWSIYWRYAWLLLNYRINARVGTQTKPYSAYKNKIVVIGDDTAFGYGDDLQLGGVPGIAGQLRRALQSERYKLRQSWIIYNRGVCGTTSADWLPSSAKPTGSGKTNFEKVFDDPLYADADVVILVVGFNDGRVSPEILPEDTVTNISATCRVLRNMGKDVWVCTVPTNGDEAKGDHFLEMNMRRNEILTGWLENNKDGISIGPRLDTLHSEFRHKSFFHSDNEHFSAKGYRKIAKDLADMLPSSLIKREFAKFQKDLKF